MLIYNCFTFNDLYLKVVTPKPHGVKSVLMLFIIYMAIFSKYYYTSSGMHTVLCNIKSELKLMKNNLK